MRDYRDAKAMAQTLRRVLTEKNVSLTHSESLELVAKALGIKDWNTLAARIRATEPAPTATQSRRKAPSQAASSESLPLVPLRDVVVFPNMTLPIWAGREKTMRALECALKGDGRVFLVAQKVETEEQPGAEGLYKTGTVGSVLSTATSSNEEDLLMSFVSGHYRASIMRFQEHHDFNVAAIERIDDDYGDPEKTQILLKELLEEMPFFSRSRGWGRAPSWRPKVSGDPARAADAVASWLTGPIAQRQELLETVDVAQRIEKLLALMRQNRQAA